MVKRPDAFGEMRVTLEGPFFTRDVRKTVKANIRDMMEALAEEGQHAVRSDIADHAGRMPNYTGWSLRRSIGRVESLSGKDWAATMVVSANTAGMGQTDAIRTKAAASTIEARWHPFRRASAAIRRSRAIIYANLTEGLE